MGTNGKGGKKDGLLKVEVGISEIGNAEIRVSSIDSGILFLGLTVPRNTMLAYAKEKGGKITPLDALHHILEASFEATLGSIREFMQEDDKK